jgi:hypothetical protein
MTAEIILAAVRETGGQIWVEAGNLKYRLPAEKSDLIPMMRELKSEILELLSERPAMPAGVRLVHWEPKADPIELPQGSVVTDVEKFIGTTLAQLDAKLNGKSWQAGNWPLFTLIERLAACGCIVALDDPRKALQ